MLAASCLLCIAGCTGESSQPAKPSDANSKAATGNQPSVKKATHGGTLVPLGQETFGQVQAHLEFVLDPETGTLTMFILDSAASQPLPIRQRDAKMTVMLMSDDGSETKDRQSFFLPLKAAAPGEVTEMSGQSEQLKGARRFEATLDMIMIGPMPFKGSRFSFPDGTEQK
jgi:hypothetical protein